MINFITTGDFHLKVNEPLGKRLSDGRNSRLIDKLNILDRVFNFAIQKQVTFVVIDGDIFETHTPSALLRTELSKLLAKLNSNGILIFMIPGNHDIQENVYTYESEESLLSESKLRVITNCHVCKEYGLKIAFVPYSRDFNSIESYISKLDKTTILFGHFPILGAKFDNNSVSMEGVNAEVFKHIAFAYLGHFHRPQFGPNWIYAGSPFNVDFKSIDSKKGFIYTEVEPSEGKFNNTFISCADKQFDLVELYESNYETIDSSLYKDHIVKLRFRGTQDWISSIDRHKIQREWYNNGVDKVIVESEIEKKTLINAGDKVVLSTTVDSVKWFAEKSNRIDMMELGNSLVEQASKQLQE